jgi:hypothetical protein
MLHMYCNFNFNIEYRYTHVYVWTILEYHGMVGYQGMAIPWYMCTPSVLREAMQALVRVQAHMLARIVVEIRAADIAVELEPQL